MASALEVPGRHDADVRLPLVARRGGRAHTRRTGRIGAPHGSGRRIAGQREIRDHSHGLHAGQFANGRLQAVNGLLHEKPRASGGEAAGRPSRLDARHVPGLEAQVHAPELHETAQEQRGRYAQQHRNRHFPGDQPASHAGAGPGDGAARQPQKTAAVVAGDLERRGQPRQDRARHTGRHREPPDRRARAGFGQARRAGRRQSEERLPNPPPHCDTGSRSQRGEDERFGKTVAHEARRSRAERRADGQLAPAGARPREQQARDVGAPDEQHARDR